MPRKHPPLHNFSKLCTNVNTHDNIISNMVYKLFVPDQTEGHETKKRKKERSDHCPTPIHADFDVISPPPCNNSYTTKTGP